MINLKPLIDKGYVPLPIPRGAKGPRIREWSKVYWTGDGRLVRPDGREAWRRPEAENAGIRLDGLVMIDFDLDVDAEIVDDLVALVPGDVPRRWRTNSARTALLFRCNEDIGRRTTSRWEGIGRIEALGGPGRQCFAFGTHPSGVPLRWTKELPATRALPQLPGAEVARTLERLEAALVRQFGPPHAPAEAAGPNETAFDITPEMVFPEADGTVWTVEGLSVIVRDAGRAPKVSLANFRPDSDSFSGIVYWSRELECLQIWDPIMGVNHFEARVGPDSAPELPALAEGFSLDMIKPLGGAGGALSEPPAPKWVFVKELSAGGGAYLEIKKPLAQSLKASGLFAGMSKERRQELQRQIPIVERALWDPREPEGIKGNAFNTFRYPRWKGAGEVDTFRRAVAGILPRDFHVFEQWLAAKVQDPALRLFPVALVGPPGSGKTTLWRVLQTLWGAELVSLSGTMESAFRNRFHGYKYRKVYALFDEVSEADQGHDGRSRKRAANVLKLIGDTESTTEELDIKYGRQGFSIVAATVGVTTNEMGALPLREDDRRWAVFETGGALQSNPLITWARNEGNRAAFFTHYGALSIAEFDPRTPPRTEARLKMIEMGKSDLDEQMEEFFSLVAAAGGFATRAEFKMWCEKCALYGAHQTAAGRVYKNSVPHDAGRVKIDGRNLRVRSLVAQKVSEDVVRRALQLLRAHINEEPKTKTSPVN